MHFVLFLHFKSFFREWLGTTEFRQSIVNMFVSWQNIAVLGKLMSPKSLCDIWFKGIWSTEPFYLISDSVRLCHSTERNKSSCCRTPGLALVLIPWFTLFTLLNNNLVVCKQEYESVEVLTGNHWLETGLFCLSSPRFSHLSYLLLLTQYWREAMRTRPLYCAFVCEHEI